MAAASPTVSALHRKRARKLVLAIALASGTVFGMTAFEAPAYAQKKKDKDSGKATYSKEFVAVYQPVADKVKGGVTDTATLKADVPSLIAVSVSEDERFASGNLIFSIGQKAQDIAVVYISHFLEEVKVVADRITVLRDGCTVGGGTAEGLSTPK